MLEVVGDSEFLSQFSEGTPEREYYATLLSVVRTADFPLTRAAGFALLRFLTSEDFIVGSLDSRSHPVSGSVQADSELVAHVFQSVNADPDWWWMLFNEMKQAEFDLDLVSVWREAFLDEIVGGDTQARD